MHSQERKAFRLFREIMQAFFWPFNVLKNLYFGSHKSPFLIASYFKLFFFLQLGSELVSEEFTQEMHWSCNPSSFVRDLPLKGQKSVGRPYFASKRNNSAILTKPKNVTIDCSLLSGVGLFFFCSFKKNCHSAADCISCNGYCWSDTGCQSNYVFPPWASAKPLSINGSSAAINRDISLSKSV